MERINERILEVLKELDDSDIISIWNSYCDEVNRYDDRIYYMEELNDIFQGQDADYILCRAFYGHDEGIENSSFNPVRDYFMFNAYGNLVSFDYASFNQYSGKFMLSDFDYEVNSIIDYMIDNHDSFGIDEVEDILEDMEDMEA